ncbi:MAG: PIG-L family deacetylase [Gammaproteobacteria bacterium]
MQESPVPNKADKRIGGKRALVFAAHPDDEVFGCAGAIMRHVQDGDNVQVIIVTDGAYPVKDSIDPQSYRKTRQQESIAAAWVLGYGLPDFWGLPDQGVEYGEVLVERMVEAIFASDADTIYTPSVYEAHSDHRVVALSAMEAVRRCERNVELLMYEVGVPLRPNTLLDITSLMDRKSEAMACFKSQLRYQSYDEQITALNRFRTYTLPAQIQSAEAYRKVTALELANNPLLAYGLEQGWRQDLVAVPDGRNVPLVSVIMRSIDRPQLEEALHSVDLQTYPNIEVIVVNAKGHGHSQIGKKGRRFTVRVAGGGEALPRSRAANIGLEKARGDYIIFLDDDDMFYPSHVAGLMEAIQGSDSAKAAYAGVREETIRRDGSKGPVVIRNSPFNVQKLFVENFIPMHAVLFDRSLLDNGVRVDENLQFYEDWDLWLQIALRSPFVHVDKISACYRNSGACGFGPEPDKSLVIAAKTAFYEKWIDYWSRARVRDIICRSIATRDVEQIRLKLIENRNRLQMPDKDIGVSGLRSAASSRPKSFWSRVRSITNTLLKNTTDRAGISRDT